MADISKCSGIGDGVPCPKRETCWRYLAPASERQSWIIAPFAGVSCDYYWPAEPRTTKHD